jgi:5-methylthioadenosine/S-adenosylhomocysteine deaminase
LTPGKRADIITIRATDLNMVPLGEIECAIVRSATVSNVDTVIADGRILKRGGKLLSVDVEKVKREANESLADILNRAGGGVAGKH